MLGEPSIILRLPCLLHINTDWCFTTCTTILIIMDGTRPWLLMLVRYNSVFVPLCSPNTCKYVFNPKVTAFQSNCAEGLHFSAFHYICIEYYYFRMCILLYIKLLQTWFRNPQGSLCKALNLLEFYKEPFGLLNPIDTSNYQYTCNYERSELSCVFNGTDFLYNIYILYMFKAVRHSVNVLNGSMCI